MGSGTIFTLQHRCGESNCCCVPSSTRIPCELTVCLHSAQRALAATKEALKHIGDGVLIADSHGRITYLNPLAEELSGWSCSDALGKPMEAIFQVINRVDRSTVANPARRAMTENIVVKLAADSLLIRRDGSELAIEDSAAPVLDENQNLVGVTIVFHDMRRSVTQTLWMEHLAQHDYVTGLPNRLLLIERLTRAIGLSSRHNKPLGLLFVDLDGFKAVNDSRAHQTGDRVLRTVAELLQSAVRGTDTVCRAGGDEFLILLTEIETAMDAAPVAEKLLSALREDSTLNDQCNGISASIGIGIFPTDGADVETLIHNADLAMYRAKALGGNGYQFFGDSDGN
jgi:diguanylate cyclase (GGDEF)-like protein/PAS domain S-box-containing protein